MPSQAGRSKRQKAMSPLEPGETISARVLMARPSAKWAVAGSEDGRLFVLQVLSCGQAFLSVVLPIDGFFLLFVALPCVTYAEDFKKSLLFAQSSCFCYVQVPCLVRRSVVNKPAGTAFVYG